MLNILHDCLHGMYASYWPFLRKWVHVVKFVSCMHHNIILIDRYATAIAIEEWSSTPHYERKHVHMYIRNALNTAKVHCTSVHACIGYNVQEVSALCVNPCNSYSINLNLN